MPPNKPSRNIVVSFKAKFVVFVGTKDWMITIPSWYRSHQGLTQKTIRHFVGKRTIPEFVEDVLSNKQLSLEQIKNKLLAMEIPETKFIDINNDLEDFRISNTWFNKSITIKQNGRWKPLCFLGKDAGFIKNFYNK